MRVPARNQRIGPPRAREDDVQLNYVATLLDDSKQSNVMNFETSSTRHSPTPCSRPSRDDEVIESKVNEMERLLERQLREMEPKLRAIGLDQQMMIRERETHMAIKTKLFGKELRGLGLAYKARKSVQADF